MYVSHRPKLSSSLVLSPFEKLKEDSTKLFVGFLIAVALCFVWTGLSLLASYIISFVCGNEGLKILSTNSEEVITGADIYVRPWMELIRLAGYIMMFIIVFRRFRRK